MRTCSGWVPSDSDDLGRLFDSYARLVYNYCFRRTGDWALAEDLTSAVFLEAWRRRGEVELSEPNARAWLLGVATNLLRNQRRSLRRHAAALGRLSLPPVEADFSDDLAARLDAEGRMREVLDLLGQMPRKHREVWALCVWSGLSYEEAAVALRVPVGTVRSRLARARARVAELAAKRPMAAETNQIAAEKRGAGQP